MRSPISSRSLRRSCSLRYGYATALVGKWNLGHYARACWPTSRGFDAFVGLVGAGYDNYTTHTEFAAAAYADLFDGDVALGAAGDGVCVSGRAAPRARG